MLKIGIIGNGGISHAHMKGYLELKDICKVATLCDTSSEQTKGFQKKYGLSLPAYNDYKELFAGEDLDAVSICTPPYTHKDITIEALRAGVHVLCEKPMAPSVQDCEEMNEVQKETGKLLAVCHQNRFRNDIQEVKHVIDSGILGKILFSRIDSFWWRSKSYYDLWWRGRWETEGGGCLLNHSVHQIDLMLWFLGYPQALSSFCANLAHNNSEVEDFATALIKFKDNSLVQFSTSVMCHGEDQQLYFQCEKGKIVSPWDLYCSLGQANGFPVGRDENFENEVNKVRKSFIPLKYEGHEGAVSNFLQSILGEKDILITGKEGKQTVELITAMYQVFHDSSLNDCVVDNTHSWYSFEGILTQARHFYEKTKSVESLEGDIVVGKSQ